jgi:hypothetical protein
MPSFGGEVKLSVPCRSFAHVKEPYSYRGSRNCRLNLIGHFSPIVLPLANRSLSRRLMWSTSGDEGGTKADLVQLSLGRLQYIRWVTAGPAQKTKTNIFHTSLQWAQITVPYKVYTLQYPEECGVHQKLSSHWFCMRKIHSSIGLECGPFIG